MIESGTDPTKPLSSLAPSRPVDRLADQARERSRALQTEQVRLLFDSAPAALAATIVCVVMLTAVEWTASPRLPLLAWLVVMAIVTSLRYLLVMAFRHAPPEEQTNPRWKARFLIGAGIAGLAWGSTMFLVLPESSIPHQMFLVFMLGGITAGAVSTLSARLDAFLCFALPTIVPVVAYFLTSGDTLTTAMAAMIVIFAVAMTYVAARVNSTLVHSLTLRLQITDLLERIQSQRERIERTEQARASSDRRYQFFVDQASDIIYRTDQAGRFTFINTVAARVLQYSEAEILGRHFSDLIRLDWRRTVSRFYDRQFVRRVPTTYFEFPAVTKDGREIWIGQNVQVLMGDGTVTGFQAVARDITDRKLTEARLKSTTQKLETLIQTSPLAIMSLDTTGNTVVRWNRAAEEMFGWRKEEVLGRPLPNVPPDMADHSAALWQQAVRDGYLRGVELKRRRKDGALIDIALWVTVVKDAEGRIVDTFGILEDITERKRAEAALQQSQTRLQRALHEREQLARNLHDNIIQSIYAIGFTLEDCQRLSREAPEEADQKLDEIIGELNRIIREVRGYLVASPEETELLSADELLTSLQRLGRFMENTNEMRFAIMLDAAAAERLTAGQRAQFLYVAQEAMSNSLRHSSASAARVSLDRTPGGVRLEIRDDGVGFALPQIRNGIGGLKNIRLRARKIGATLDITSRPMGGTVISMEVPGAHGTHVDA